MKTFEEPRRLWQDEGAPAALQKALNAGRHDKANARAMAAMAAGLAAAGVPLGGGAAVAGVGVLSKVLIGAAIVGAMGSGAYVLQTQRASTPPQNEGASAPATLVVPKPMPQPTAEERSAAVAPAIHHAAAPPKGRKPQARVIQDAEPSIIEETAWLEDTRRLLPNQPNQALLRLQTYAMKFKHPLLDQEAAVLKIEALVAAGQRSTAQQRAGEFFHNHPQSPHRQRVQRLLNLQP
ncbi:MAG: hypothetical protein SF187_29170 [Deltaproteobacteria bacterium]|nr:hypothetical protein [Deltaproteobacteria bacterium]